MEQYDIALIGGDERIAYMQPYLSGQGYRVISYGTCILPNEKPGPKAGSLEEAVQARCIVAGIPFIKNGKINAKQMQEDLKPEMLMDCMKKGQKLFAGIIPGGFVELCEKQGISCYDFMKDEALTVFNAIATAEGAVLEALYHQKTNLHGSKSLVLGYGRCGKVLAEKLKGMGAKVTVCARNSVALANADAFGMDVMDFSRLKNTVQEFEYVFNTVPAPLLDKELLSRMQKNVIIVDIASAPGGADQAAAKSLGIQCLFCPGLPGKYAPKSSAKGLAKYVKANIET